MSSLHHTAGRDFGPPAQAVSSHSAAPIANVDMAWLNPADWIDSI